MADKYLNLMAKDQHLHTNNREARSYIEPKQSLRLSEVVSAMTYALDITEGQPEGHAMRSCIIGMRIGQTLNLDSEQLSDLYYALLLKDLGCSSTSSKVRHLFGADDQHIKPATKTVNFHNKFEGLRFVLKNAGKAAPFVKRLKHMMKLIAGKNTVHAKLTQTRCERGADIALEMGFSEATAQAIRSLDEHWNGRGRPYQLERHDIPLLGRILCLAQTLEVFYREKSPKAAIIMAKARAGSWFDPVLVEAFDDAQQNPLFWAELETNRLEQRVSELEPSDRIVEASDEHLDHVAQAFARVIDAKSPWTYKHSERVKQLALGAASQLPRTNALSALKRKQLSRAALLHDIGKLGVSNLILDKSEKLSDEEFAAIRAHPAYSEKILARVEPFQTLAPLVIGHHERMDGRGYPYGIPAAKLEFEVRLLAVADQFEALTSARPYREALSVEEALELIEQDAGKGVDPKALDALKRFLNTAEAASLLSPQASDPEVPLPKK